MFLSEFTKSGGRDWKVFIDPDRIWGIEQNGSDSTLLVDRTGSMGKGGGYWAVNVRGSPDVLYAQIIADRLVNHKRPLTMSRVDAVALMEERLTGKVLDKVVELLEKDAGGEIEETKAAKETTRVTKTGKKSF